MLFGQVGEETTSEYGGPAILGRGAGAFNQPGEPIKFRPYISLDGIYEEGLRAPSVRLDGSIPRQNSYGGQVAVGLSGTRAWRKSVVSVDYRGDYRHYTSNRYFNGSNQNLTLGLRHALSKRLVVSIQEAAGTTSRGAGQFGGYSQGLAFNPELVDVPQDELFDGRTTYFVTQGDLVFQKTARLSVGLGGGNFIIRRQSSALYGVTGGRARGTLAYRLSRRTTLTSAYDFTNFKFTQGFGGSDVHGVKLGLSHALTRTLEIALSAGANRVETLGLTRVTLDPEIAAIIGQRVGTEVVYRVNYLPDLMARIRKEFERGALAISYTRGISGGNGLLLTSAQKSINGGYTYQALRRLAFSLSGGHSTYSSLAQTLGKFQTYRGSVGLNYRLTGSLHAHSRFDYFRPSIANTGFRQDRQRFTVGFRYAPGDIPLAFW